MVQSRTTAAEEVSPLIKPPVAASRSNHHQQTVEDPGWSEDAIRTLFSTTVFLILFTLADLFKYVAIVRLLELGVCREYQLQHHPSLVDDNGNVPEKLCKLAEIQQHLAHLRGYYSALDSVVGLVLTVPYGLVVGRLGERLLIAINVVGYLLSCAWFLVVCSSWDTFSTWMAVLSPLFRAIGGGSPFLFSLVYSIAAKHIPSSKRSSAFFIFLAAQTITSTFATLIAATFLDHGLLFLPLLLNFPIGLFCIASLALVRGTKSSESSRAGREDVQDYDNNTNNGNLTASRSIRHSGRMLGEALRNPAVFVLLSTVPVAKAVNPIGELTWQYIPKRFGISFAETSRVLSIPSLECVLLLLFILPNIKSVAQNRYHARSIKVDLYFVQFGFLIQAVGCIVMAFAPALIVFILGILVFALGCSTRPALQSVLADLTSPEHVTVLFTVIAVADLIGSAAGTLLLNWTFSIALDWEMDLYLGSPFAIFGILFIAAFVASVYIGRGKFRHSRRDA